MLRPTLPCTFWPVPKGVLCTCLGSKGQTTKDLGPISARQLHVCNMCMPMRPNKAETAVHGCHYLGQEPTGLLPGWYGCAYARPWLGVWACHLLLLFEKRYLSCRLCQICVNSHNKNRMAHPLRVAKNCMTHPLPRIQKLMTHPLSALPPPCILFDKSLMPRGEGVSQVGGGHGHSRNWLTQYKGTYSAFERVLLFLIAK